MVRTPSAFQSFTVSNKAFTHQMLGQQLIVWLSQELNQKLDGYYKYNKITIYSTDSHLNHQIFVSKLQLIEKLISLTQERFGRTIVIKDILFRAQSASLTSDTGAESEINMKLNDNHYDGEDLDYE